MKIVHLSTSDKIGGAALAAKRLNDAFNQANVTSKLIVLNQHNAHHKDIIYNFYSKRKKEKLVKT